MTDDTMIEGMTMADWRSMPWWPNDREARIEAGPVGHEHEIVVNIDGYWGSEYIPDVVGDVLAAILPEPWRLENRSTRIELHPTGRLFGGFAVGDTQIAASALQSMGLRPVGKT
jgi:hypothetical protein